MRNHLIGLAFSDCELFSNLEWAQNTYDRLRGAQREPDFPTHTTVIAQAAQAAAESLRSRVIGQVKWLSSDELGTLVGEIGALYADSTQLDEMLKRLATGYPRQ